MIRYLPVTSNATKRDSKVRKYKNSSSKMSFLKGQHLDFKDINNTFKNAEYRYPDMW